MSTTINSGPGSREDNGQREAGLLRLEERFGKQATRGRDVLAQHSHDESFHLPGEPDLALILGRPDTLPTSLVWELAYSELVFLDIDWSALQAGHLEMAIDDFNRRHRRFGGLDS